MINDRGFYTPPSRRQIRIERHQTLLHCLGGAALGVAMAVMFFFAIYLTG